MTKLKVISWFFMLLMLMQVLPVRQIGNALSQNQWTEELPHNSESGIEDPAGKAFLPAIHYNHEFDGEASAALIYVHSCDRIPSNHSTDIVSPPPDVLA